jgi:hypothetical protein
MTAAPEHVVGVGVDLLADAAEAQAVDVTRVDWRPPMTGTEADLAVVAADPRRRAANEKALARSTSPPPPTSSGSNLADSSTPGRPSPGTGPPARCAAR